MELLLINTPTGLIPLDDSSYDEKRRLRLGETYKATVVVPRNLLFHRKYFALINCAWEYVKGSVQEKFFHNSKEAFRKTIQISAGYYNTIYSIQRKEFIEEAASISFGSMDELEFQQLYEKVKDVLFATFLRDISEQEFMSNLSRF